MPSIVRAAVPALGLPPVHAATDRLLAPAPGYCPPALLASFAWLMAGQGRCVNSAMMLGDRDYALWQLACAHATGDAELQGLAERLASYFSVASSAN